jgi:uncharacterized protein (TIRG00374 family)
MRKTIQLLIGFLVAAVCLYYAFRGISFERLWDALRRASLLPIFIAALIYMVDFILRSKRWSILMNPVHKTGHLELFWVMLIGYFANNILPLRMGELVRAHVCGTKLKISRTATLGTILMERLCDTVSFLTTFLVASLFFPFPSYMKKGAWLLGGTCLAVIVVLLLMHHQEEVFWSLLEWMPLPHAIKTRVQDLTTHFLHSTSGITRPRFLLEAMAFSLAVWVIEGTYLYLISRAFAIHLNYPGAFFLLFALGLSVTLPQAPGYVGTFELFGVTALSLLGIPKEQGLPVILAIHGTQFLFIAILGTIGLWQEGLNFHNLTSTS